jgi:hypothetical protein
VCDVGVDEHGCEEPPYFTVKDVRVELPITPDDCAACLKDVTAEIRC